MESTIERRKSVKQIKAELGVYWFKILEHFKAEPKQYCPHMIYPVKAAPKDKFVKLYKEEISWGKDLFLECADKQYQTEDTPRRLYKLKYDPAWKSVRLADKETLEVSLRDAEVITDPNQYKVPVASLEANTDTEEDDLSNMTISDLAAILWQRPVSSKSFLNKLIEKEFFKH